MTGVNSGHPPNDCCDVQCQPALQQQDICLATIQQSVRRVSRLLPAESIQLIPADPSSLGGQQTGLSHLGLFVSNSSLAEYLQGTTMTTVISRHEGPNLESISCDIVTNPDADLGSQHLNAPAVFPIDPAVADKTPQWMECAEACMMTLSSWQATCRRDGHQRRMSPLDAREPRLCRSARVHKPKFRQCRDEHAVAADTRRSGRSPLPSHRAVEEASRAKARLRHIDRSAFTTAG
ncbi:hypothetical protein FB567DRAFT_350974 [Paraphoma chrysanthemicola]|uniref:Uncharacterized protein n=1 Tax=Paraphoma chrysanthemicola TaxID=798071 RepID=A0A8K0R5S0_9PLEO|nr:hypothetical protein FB567DRAFT_350974 [Paraphoma chrysanthemicola]